MSTAPAPPPWYHHQQQPPTPIVLRLFEAGDLPTTRGTFLSPQSTAMIIRTSRQTGDVAGITDNPNAKNEPTLKRFSRYNTSMTVRPPSSLSIATNRATSSSTPMSTRSTRRELFLNQGGTERSSVDSGNWTLRDRPPELRSSSVMSSNITVVPVGDYEDNTRRSKSSLRVSVGGTTKSHVLTNGHMRLVKSGSVGDFVIDGNYDDCMDVKETDNNRRKTERDRDQRCSASVGRRVLYRKPLGGVFSQAVTCDACCCHCTTKDHQPVATSSPKDINDTELSFTTRLAIDVDSSFGTEESGSPSSTSLTSSSADRQSASIIRKSCPDLLRTDEDENTTSSKAIRTSADRTTVRSRKTKEKRRAALIWQRKPLKQWTLDDVLLWLQHIRLDEVASLVIGYDLTGADLEKWDHEALESLGVDDELLRQCVLKELAALRRTQLRERDRSNPAGNRVVKKTASLRVPLFNLVRSSSYDQIVAVETPLTTRDISVAETQQGCLQVTKVNGAVPLKEGDCLLEINSKPAHGVRSLMFTKLITQAAGDPIRLVVLRRHAIDDDANDNDSVSVGYSTPRMTRRPAVAEQLSTGSSGVSSNEIADSPSFDDNFHVLHF